eukprot:TRINITY_DN4094_c0_g1_i1.p1 TRINITY_DN4094_c0_g1~~TRINITY_DN4094_c0_g1_i1.p1  ORF type:complete len:254 (-),score=63.83 TRINITY_DN4094_c0_g1_i1:137-898(-)
MAGHGPGNADAPSRTASKAKLPPLGGSASQPMMVEDSRRSTSSLLSSSSLLSTTGVVARRRACAQLERLDPLKSRGLDPTGCDSMTFKPAFGNKGLPLPAKAAASTGLGPGGASFAGLGQSLAKPVRQASCPLLSTSPSKSWSSQIPGVAGSRPVDNRGLALVAELGGARTAEGESKKEVEQREAVRSSAVASLQRLFFEEVKRGGDVNAAAAAALKRLAEETRPADVPSNQGAPSHSARPHESQHGQLESRA